MGSLVGPDSEVSKFVAWMTTIAPQPRSSDVVSVVCKGNADGVQPDQYSTSIDSFDPKAKPFKPTGDFPVTAAQINATDSLAGANVCNFPKSEVSAKSYGHTSASDTFLSRHKLEAQSRVAQHAEEITSLPNGTTYAAPKSTVECASPVSENPGLDAERCNSDAVSPLSRKGVAPPEADDLIGDPVESSPVKTSLPTLCSPTIPSFKGRNNLTVGAEVVDLVGQPSTEDEEVAYDTAQASELFSKLTAENAGGDDSNADTRSPTVVATPYNRKTTEQEDRTYMKHFSSWGTPVSRDKSPSQVRKIILKNMPPNIDFTFLQSLIHMGAIEIMTMSPAHNTAYVMFTSGDACTKYYDHYPNGLEIRHQGRKWVIFIEKGSEVDVVSGILQGQLDCGASRVVRAAGADDEWTMRALRKVAAGPKDTRRVEAIIDTWRNATRLIDFHFCDIADAVAFRAQLKRDIDWLDCTIGFATDPCETATGIHFD